MSGQNNGLLYLMHQKQNFSLLLKKSGHHVHPPLYLNNTAINEVKVHKHLGHAFNNKMSWTDHIKYICKKM
jgi:hypothetical protein